MISLLLTANHADSHPSFAVLRELLSAVAERSDVVAYAERVLNFVQDHELEERGAGPQKFALRIVISIMQSLHDNIDSVPAVLAGVCQALRDTLFVPELQEASATRFFSSEHFLVEAILVSVISMLSAPNNDSPANVDAGVQFREDPAAFKRQVQRTVRRSQEEC